MNELTIYEQIEDSIVSQLKEGAGAQVSVIPYPDAEADYERPGENGQRGKIQW
jgi:hypothetical protein